MELDDLLPTARTPADYLRAVRDPRLSDSGLSVLAGSPYSFVRLAVARCDHARAAQLLRLLDGEYSEWDLNAVLRLVARHDNADRRVLLAVLGRTAELLRAGARPYAATLALAKRPELRPEEIRPLGGLAGASRRLRRGLDRALDARAPTRPRSAHDTRSAEQVRIGERIVGYDRDGGLLLAAGDDLKAPGSTMRGDRRGRSGQ